MHNNNHIMPLRIATFNIAALGKMTKILMTRRIRTLNIHKL
jgi:hypothetical protein